MDSQEASQLALRSKHSRPFHLNAPAGQSRVQARDGDICARLVTTTKAGRKEGWGIFNLGFNAVKPFRLAAAISIGKPVTIGRSASQWLAMDFMRILMDDWKFSADCDASSTYVIPEAVVSNVHFKVYA